MPDVNTPPHWSLLLISQDNETRERARQVIDRDRLHVAYSASTAAHIYHHDAPPAVLIDLTLRGIDWAALLANLRQQGDPPVRVLALVPPDDEAAVARALSLGVEHCLQAPLNPMLLRHHLERLLTPTAEPPTSTAAADRYRSLFNAAGDAIFLTQAETGRIVDANQRAAQWLGYPRAALIGMKLDDIEVATDDIEGDTLISSRSSSGGHFIYEQPYRTRDGRMIPAEVSCRFLTLDGERLLVSYVRDMTDRVAMQRQVTQQRLLADTLRRTAALLTSTLDHNEVIAWLLDQVMLVLPADAANVMLIEGDVARVMGATGYDGPQAAPWLNLDFPLDAQLQFAEIQRTQQPVVIKDAATDPRWNRLTPDEWVRGYIGAPLLIDGEVVGFLNIDSTQPDVLNDDHADLLLAFANLAAIALQNARLHAALQRYADDMALQADERSAMLHALINNVPDEIYARDLTGRYLMSNAAHTRRVQAARGDNRPVGHSQGPPFSPLEQRVIHQERAAITQERQVDVGRWLLVTHVPLFDAAGDPRGIISIHRDVSAVREAEARVTDVIQGAYCLLWTMLVSPDDHGDLAARALRLPSEQAAQNFLPLDLAAGGTYADAFKQAILPDDFDAVVTAGLVALRENAPGYHVEFRCRGADGALRWLREEVRIRPTGDGRRSLVGVVTDVTERRLAEETMRNANEYLESRVLARTEELETINQRLRQQIDERTRAELAERDQRRFAETLSRASSAFSETLDFSGVLDVILRHVSEVLPPVDTLSVMLIEDDIYVRAIRSQHPGDKPSLSQNEGNRYLLETLPLLQAVHRSGRPIAVPDAQQDARWGQHADTDWVRAYMAVPIVAQGSILGFLNAASSTPDQFNDQHLERALAFAGQAGIAIQNARLFEAVRHHTTELRQRVRERTVELETERSQLHAILNAMNEGVIYADLNGRVYYVNDSLIHMTGYSEAEWRAQPDIWQQLFVEDEQPYSDFRVMVDRALARHHTWTGQLRLKPRTGEPFEANVVTRTVPAADGSYDSAVTVVRDISAEKRLESQKTRFIATASHELRTPITNLKTRLFLLEKRPETLDKHLPVLAAVTDRMRWLVDDLLDLSRFENGVIALDRQPTDVIGLIDSIVEELRPEANAHGLTLQTRQRDEVLMADLDAARINQVMTNLVNNAINYTPEGGSVVVSAVREARDGQAGLALRVQDSGVGIPAHLLNEVFTPFFRVNDQNQVVGTGLGLSISREIVLQHQGSIHVESEEGVGTTFIVWLPLR